MGLDAQFLKLLAEELDTRLKLARIDRIVMPSRDEAVFDMHTQSGKQRLLICSRSGSARAHLTTESFERPDVPSSFCMLLRKYLGHGRLDSVKAVEGERVILFEFTSVAETGDLMNLLISVEMMGRYSNIVLVRDGIVVDALKRISFEQSEVRQLIPGVPFSLPPAQDKLIFSKTPAQKLADTALSSDKPEISERLLSTVAGISPVACREIAFRATGTSLVSEIERAQTERRLTTVFDGEKPVEFSFMRLTQYENLSLTEYASPSALLDAFYGERDAEERRKSYGRDLTKQIDRLLSRAVKKHDTRLNERGDSAAADQKRLYGELLTANLSNKTSHSDSITVLNYYTSEEIVIPLDKRLSLAANAQKYYKEYRKLNTARSMLDELLKGDEREIAYLSSVAYAASRSASEQEFDAIREELKASGYLRNYKPKQHKPRPQPMLKYKTSDGCTVIAGRNNRQNEQLTHKQAAKTDIWFHVKGYAGSHVVLSLSGAKASPRSYTEAALIAAYNSSASSGEQIAVDYTAVKNVKKMPDGKTGMVIYTGEKTLYVTPDAVRVAEMEDK